MDEKPKIVGTPESSTPPTPPARQPEQVPEQPRTPQPAAVAARPRQQRSGLYDQFGQTVAYSFGFAIAVALWLAGAAFTLAALTAIGVNTTNPAWWLLPLGITGAEIWLMPRAGTRWQTLILFGLVLAVDVTSSWYGVIDTLGGMFMPLGPGFTVPTSGTALHVVAVVAGLVLAFIPEKLGKYAGAELVKVWR